MQENLKKTLHELYASKTLIELSIQRIEKILENEVEKKTIVGNELPKENLNILKNLTECPIFVSGNKRPFDDFYLDKYTSKNILRKEKLESSNIKGLIEEEKLQEITEKQMKEEIENGGIKRFPNPKGDTPIMFDPIVEGTHKNEVKLKTYYNETEGKNPPSMLITNEYCPEILKKAKIENFEEYQAFREQLKNIKSEDLKKALDIVFDNKKVEEKKPVEKKKKKPVQKKGVKKKTKEK